MTQSCKVRSLYDNVKEAVCISKTFNMLKRLLSGLFLFFFLFELLDAKPLRAVKIFVKMDKHHDHQLIVRLEKILHVRRARTTPQTISPPSGPVVKRINPSMMCYMHVLSC
ncbi:hypothetical protein L596_002513 [Steinernema carpocapsae]|uniref:Uncharacterized protein n=1 Tax=Steinernema carpocapsae TaxID=34508 RepID=A0A4V6I7F6_STECR|nr:hypothetical protein L596_002513 [Steinernema carpocapsae]